MRSVIVKMQSELVLSPEMYFKDPAGYSLRQLNGMLDANPQLRKNNILVILLHVPLMGDFGNAKVILGMIFKFPKTSISVDPAVNKYIKDIYNKYGSADFDIRKELLDNFANIFGISFEKCEYKCIGHFIKDYLGIENIEAHAPGWLGYDIISAYYANKYMSK